MAKRGAVQKTHEEKPMNANASLKQVAIMRGLPGSGKSTFVEKVLKPRYAGSLVEVFSADHYFMVRGEYTFNPAQIAQAHAWCFRQYMMALSTQEQVQPDLAVVDNTNMQCWEYDNYIRLARILGWNVRVYETAVSDVVAAYRCWQRCQHGVPLEGVMGLWRRHEPELNYPVEFVEVPEDLKRPNVEVATKPAADRGHEFYEEIGRKGGAKVRELIEASRRDRKER